MNLEQIKKEIRQADYCYYILNDPEISDKEYDDLIKKLKDLEEKHPELITPDSPTQRVSGGVSQGFATVRHKIKMLSLDNTYSINELKKWETKIKKILKTDIDIDYVVEPKIDGVSCSLNYKQGVLEIGSTRGDGQTGEDVTLNIKTIKSIPLKLRGDFPQDLEARGEVYMAKVGFAKMNEQRAKQGEPVFANPRNATGGSLKLLDASLTAKRGLECIIHSSGMAPGQKFKSHQEFLNRIKSWGLRVDAHSKHCRNLAEVIAYCLKWQEKRASLEYEVDGMVIKVNNISLQEKLGTTLKSPRWMVAYKFPAHQATTRLEKVELGVGRTGIITPVAILKPVACGGVTISRTTLHNFDEIKRLDVRQGDTVLIERAGEVIPKIIKVITSKRKGKEKKIKIPKTCPVCRGSVEKAKQGEVYWYCLNPDCPAQLKRSLLHFASRKAMDIEGLGESAVEELVSQNIIQSLVDIYKLKKEDLFKLPLFKEKKANNLVMAINKSKGQMLYRFLYGLGIKQVGEKAALVLAKRFKTIDNLFKLSKLQLEEIPEIGPIMASSIVHFFSSSKIKKMILEFKSLGLNLRQEEMKLKKTRISGKTFIFTGELAKLSRSQAQKIVEEQGAAWVSSVSKNIDFVVAGQNPGSKYAKAKKLGLKILNEQAFLSLLGQ
jgi:DNA ligase (NAD+)